MNKCCHYERDETRHFTTEDCLSCKHASGVSAGDGSFNLHCRYETEVTVKAEIS